MDNTNASSQSKFYSQNSTRSCPTYINENLKSRPLPSFQNSSKYKISSEPTPTGRLRLQSPRKFQSTAKPLKNPDLIPIYTNMYISPPDHLLILLEEKVETYIVSNRILAVATPPHRITIRKIPSSSVQPPARILRTTLPRGSKEIIQILLRANNGTS